MRSPPHPLVLSRRVCGRPILGADNRRLGRITDLAMEKLSGHAAFVIVRLDGVFRRRFRAIPWSQLRFDPGRRAYHVPLSARELIEAPDLDRARFGQGGDAVTRNANFRFYAGFGERMGRGPDDLGR